MAENVVAQWDVPDPNSLTMAELDEVLELTGIDLQAAQNLGSQGRVLAALVTWTRRRAGELVDFDDVYKTLRGNQVRVTRADPKSPST